MKSVKHITVYIILIIFTVALAVIVYAAPHTKLPKELVIVNVRPDSPRIVKDDGSIEFADNLHLRNLTDHPYDLTGLFLSDNKGDLKKYPLDGVVIEPQDSVMIKLDPSWNFALKSTGEEDVYLSDARGNVIYHYTSSMKPAQPQLSAPSGFYDEEFDLTISAGKHCRIFYTLDGSYPDESSIPYTGPIHVYDRSNEPNTVVSVPNIVINYLEDHIETHERWDDYVIYPIKEPVAKAFIIRAVAVDDYGDRSDIVTNEYFFCKDKYRNVISIVADRDELFGDYGIVSTGKEYDDWYLGDREGEDPKANYSKKGRDWEIPSEVELFYDGKTVMKGRYGLRLQGRTTRDRRIKNFQLYARNAYNGSDVFQYQFFDGEEYLPDKITLDDNFKESLLLELIKNEPLVKQRTTGRVALFLNGEFWNNVYIRQKIDAKYFLDHFGVPEDNLVIMSQSFGEYGLDDDETFDRIRNSYLAIDDFARENDLNDPANYAKLNEIIDMDTYLDYFAINLWVGCNDWGEYNNDWYWRVKEPYDDSYGDGRFRWTIHDGDYIFYDYVAIEDDVFVNEFDMISGLMKSSLFRQDVAKHLERLGQTSFSDEHVEEVIHSGKWDEPELKDAEEYLLNRKHKMAEVIEELKEYKGDNN